MSKNMPGVAVRKIVTLPSNTLGLVRDLLEKLSDPEWVGATKKFLRKENSWGEKEKFEDWKTLTIGGISKDELLKRLEDGFFVSDWAKDIMSMSGFTTLPEPTNIQLARAKVKDLGFTEMPTTDELFARIEKVGDLCPAEVGPHLAIQYKDQPNGEVLWVAMERIPGSGDGPDVFGVGRRGGGALWLDGGWAGPGGRWLLVSRILVRLRKVSSASAV